MNLKVRIRVRVRVLGVDLKVRVRACFRGGFEEIWILGLGFWFLVFFF